MPAAALGLALVPVSILYDFGICFVAYLRGVANTSSFFFELLYDYVGVVAFISRLLVQFIRIALMLAVYCTICELVLEGVIVLRSYVGNSSFWEELSFMVPTQESITLYLTVMLPARLLH